MFMDPVVHRVWATGTPWEGVVVLWEHRGELKMVCAPLLGWEGRLPWDLIRESMASALGPEGVEVLWDEGLLLGALREILHGAR